MSVVELSFYSATSSEPLVQPEHIMGVNDAIARLDAASTASRNFNRRLDELVQYVKVITPACQTEALPLKYSRAP
jgi:hypothetical protein